MSTTLLHLLPLADFRAPPGGPIGSPLEAEGFVHCSPDVSTTLAVANTLYRQTEEPMVAVELDPARLRAEIQWEAPEPAPPVGVSAETLFPHVYGPLDRDAVIAVYYARRDLTGRFIGLHQRGPTAAEFDLLPHPEGGWYRRTWVSPMRVDGGSAARSTATAIYFLLEAGETSAWHTVSSDELWLWHHGGPLSLAMGGNARRPADEPDTLTLGMGDGRHPQALVPAGTWQRAYASAETLVSCVVSPGFDFADLHVL